MQFLRTLLGRKKTQSVRRRGARRMFVEPLEPRLALTYQLGAGAGQVWEYYTSASTMLEFWRDNLDGPRPDWTDSVTVNYSLSGTATPLRDYTLARTGSITIPAHSDYAELPYKAIDDPWYEPRDSQTEYIIVTITGYSSSNSTGYDILPPEEGPGPGTVGDDDYIDDPLEPALPSCTTCSTAAAGTSLADNGNRVGSNPPGVSNSGSPAPVTVAPIRIFRRHGAPFVQRPFVRCQWNPMGHHTRVDQHARLFQ
jgi:hypothetical protein